MSNESVKDRKVKINLHPTTCNICGGQVVYTTNDSVYGRRYGSGYCYLCTRCGAYVGTHRPDPKRALGLLANKDMREWKIKCHELFDSFWKDRDGAGRLRKELYKRLADEMGIEYEMCHFGYFDIRQLKQAYQIIEQWKD